MRERTAAKVDRNAELAEDYKRGMSAIELAKKYDIARARVYQLLVKAGVQRRSGPRWTDQQLLEARKMRKDGVPLAKIAAHLGVSEKYAAGLTRGAKRLE